LELISYFLIYIFSLFFIFAPNALNKKSIFFVWLILTTILSVSLRIKLDAFADTDMGSYIRLMSSDFDLTYLNREFIFFGLSRYLYIIFENEFTVFLFWDLLIFIAYYFAVEKLCLYFLNNHKTKVLSFILFSSILFFPFVLGLHTIYRQLIASVIYLNAFGEMLNGRKIRGLILFIFSFFIHNSCFLFLPLLLLTYKSNLIKAVSIMLLLITSYFIFIIVNSADDLLYRDFQSNISGPHITRMYIISLLFISMQILFTEFFFNNFKRIEILNYLLIMFLIYIVSVLAYSSGMSERVVVFLYTIFNPIFILYNYSIFKQKKVIMLIYLHISLLPIILLHNSTIDLKLTFNL
jgi:hypothetical protein